MKIILSESQVDQTVLKFCEISFEEIKNMCDNMFSYDSWPSYLSLNTCLSYGSISKMDFFNAKSSKDESKKIGGKKYPKYFVDCRIYYNSAINMSEESLYELTQSITDFILNKYKIYVQINIVEYTNTILRQW
jgi:hypothetical protein